VIRWAVEIERAVNYELRTVSGELASLRRCGEFLDADHGATFFSALLVLHFAFVFVHFVGDLGANREFGGFELFLLFGAAGVLRAGGYKGEVVLLMFVLLVGSAGGLEILS